MERRRLGTKLFALGEGTGLESQGGLAFPGAFDGASKPQGSSNRTASTEQKDLEDGDRRQQQQAPQMDGKSTNYMCSGAASLRAAEFDIRCFYFAFPPLFDPEGEGEIFQELGSPGRSQMCMRPIACSP